MTVVDSSKKNDWREKVHNPRGPESASIEIPLQTQIYLENVPLNVNIVKQDLFQFLKILWSEVWKGGFQLMLILVLLGMYRHSSFNTVLL